MAVKPPKKPLPSFGWVQVSPNRRVTKTAATRVLARPGRVPGIGVRRLGGALSGAGTGVPTDPIQTQAEARADAQLAAQRAKIEETRRAAQEAAKRDVEALRGLGVAATGIMSGIPGQIAGIRNEAGTAIAGYGEGYAKSAQADVERGQAQTAATTEAAGQPGAPTVDASAAERATYATGGEIPATEQSQIGAATAAEAAGQPAVVMRAAQEDITSRMADAAAEDAGYRQQLLDLNAERPGLVQDAVDKLNAIEATKHQQAFENAMAEREQLLRERAELVQEMSLGARTAKEKRDYRVKLKQLDASLSRVNETIRHNKASETQKAEQASKPDSALSKTFGYIVDSNGNPILDANGKRQPVAKTGTSSPANQLKKDRASAISEVGKLRGKPVTASSLVQKPNGSKGLPAGKYKGRKGAKGLFPDGTTNDPNRAAHDGMSWQQAQTYLMQKYGFNRAQARSILIATGWKPS